MSEIERRWVLLALAATFALLGLWNLVRFHVFEAAMGFLMCVVALDFARLRTGRK